MLQYVLGEYKREPDLRRTSRRGYVRGRLWRSIDSSGVHGWISAVRATGNNQFWKLTMQQSWGLYTAIKLYRLDSDGGRQLHGTQSTEDSVSSMALR